MSLLSTMLNPAVAGAYRHPPGYMPWKPITAETNSRSEAREAANDSSKQDAYDQCLTFES